MYLYDAILNGRQPDMSYYNFGYYKASSEAGNSDVGEEEEVDQLSSVARKPVFEVADQVRLKPDCTTKEDG